MTIDRATLIIPWRELHCCEHGAYSLSLAVQHLGMTGVHRRASPAVDQSTQEQAGQRWRGDLVSMDGSAPVRHRRQNSRDNDGVETWSRWTHRHLSDIVDRSIVVLPLLLEKMSCQLCLQQSAALPGFITRRGGRAGDPSSPRRQATSGGSNATTKPWRSRSGSSTVSWNSQIRAT